MIAKELQSDHKASGLIDYVFKGREDGMKKVLRDFIELSKLDKTQYIAVYHQDTKNKHIHIVYNKILKYFPSTGQLPKFVT